MDSLYTVHTYFNQSCHDAAIDTELLVSEDDLRVVLSTKPLKRIFEELQKIAVANGIITEARNISSGTLVIMSSNPKINISSVVHSMDSKFGKFYRNLNEAFEGDISDIVRSGLERVLRVGHVNRPDQVEQQAQNEWFNFDAAKRAFRDHKEFGKAVRALFEKSQEAEATERGYDKLAGGWIGTGRKTGLGPDENEQPRAKDRFYEDRKTLLNNSLNEALKGIAVPDGAAQPKVGVEMLEQALNAKTKSGVTLKDALKKAGVTWHVAEPGSHVIVFKGKSGDEKWRVEPMTLSDKKVFEETMAALWSVALGKSPNAKKLELDAAKQHAKELGDHQKEIAGLVDQITGKYVPPAQEPEQE